MLYEDKTIELRGSGTFYTKERKPRPARNPRTGEICPLGRRRVALFRFSPEVREHIHEMPELQEALNANADLVEIAAPRATTGTKTLV